MPSRSSTRSESPAPSRPGFDCLSYKPGASSKRCRHYQDGGRCVRPQAAQGRCVEWLKVNAPTLAGTNNPPKSQPPAARDLFGNPIQSAQPRKASSSRPTRSQSEPREPVSPSPVKPPLVRNVTDEEIASFKAIGVEVCVRSDDLGEVFLVPKYTGRDRTELSIEHSITLTTICAAFPGAKVVELKRQS